MRYTNSLFFLGDRATQTYISPSDTIMSPATQKLAAFKHKHMGKGSDHLFIPKHFQDSLEPIASSSSLTALGDRSDKEPRTDCDAAANSSNATKPRSLFAATASKNHSNASAATSQSMFADISKPSDLEPEQGGS